MATQSNLANRTANAAANAAKSPVAAPAGSAPDPAAISAGIRSMIGDDGQNQHQDQRMNEGAASSVTEAELEQEEEGESALVASSEALARVEETGLVERRSTEARLPVQLDVGIPIRDFRLKNLLALEPGSLIASQWAPGEDVPVASGAVQVAWSEFEVVDMQLAVRLTRLT